MELPRRSPTIYSSTWPGRSATSTRCGPAHRSRHQLPPPAGDARGLPPATTRRSASSSPARGRSTASPEYLPVDERHPIRPVDVNGINKLAGEGYHVLYNNVYGIRTPVLRLTNTYGPRHAGQGRSPDLSGHLDSAGCWKARRSRCSATARSCATSPTSTTRSTLPAAPAPSDAANGQVFNVGSRRGRSVCRELAELLIARRRRRQLRAGAVPAGAQGDRHRRLLQRFLAHPPKSLAGCRGFACTRGCSARSTTSRGTARITGTPIHDRDERLQRGAGHAARGHDGRRRPGARLGLVCARPRVRAIRVELGGDLRRRALRRLRQRARRHRARFFAPWTSAPATRWSPPG